MYCYKKQSDGTIKRMECLTEEEALSIAFCKKYTVRYHACTEGLYGSEQIPTTLSEFKKDSTPAEMECILAEQDGAKVVIGCVCGDKTYYIDGPCRYEQNSGPGPQDALIWDYKEWMLVEREQKI